MIMEIIAAHFNIPLSTGFSSEKVSFFRKDSHKQKIGELHAGIIRKENVDKHLNYFKSGTTGINLLKIHGALDVFTYQDGRDIIKFLPIENTIEGIVSTIKAINDDLKYFEDYSNKPWRCINEITCTDSNDEMHFLRRTLLSGSYKFDPRGTQTLPLNYINHFKSYIVQLTNLTCIGYSFGDSHIDKIIKEWLEGNLERKLTIVNPGLSKIPSFLLHLQSQLTLITLGTTDYLDSIAGITRTRRERSIKEFHSWFRANAPDKETYPELISFINKQSEIRIKYLAKKIGELPRRDGDIDLETLGLTKEEFVKKFQQDNPLLFEDMLDQILSDMKREKEGN
jgi:hypothetical protein